MHLSVPNTELERPTSVSSLIGKLQAHSPQGVRLRGNRHSLGSDLSEDVVHWQSEASSRHVPSESSRGVTPATPAADSVPRRGSGLTRSLGSSLGTTASTRLGQTFSTRPGFQPQLAMSILAQSEHHKADAAKFGVLVRKLLGDIGIGKYMDKTALVKVPDVVGFVSCSRGTVLFEEGAMPEHCFLVLQGRVQLWRQGPECDVPWPAEEGSLSARKHCTAIASSLLKLSKKEGSWPGRAAATDSSVQGGHVVNSCGPGTLCGDTELLELQPRLVTGVVCSDSCELLVIGRSDFNGMLRPAILKCEAIKASAPIREMLSQFNFFQRMAEEVKASVAEIMHFEYLRRGSVVFRQGDPPGLCYILLRGDVGVWVAGLEEDESEKEKRESLVVDSLSRPMSRQMLSRSVSRSTIRDSAQPVMREMPTRVSGSQAVRGNCLSILGCLRRVYALKKIAADFESPPVSPTRSAGDVRGAKQVAWLGPGKMFGELALLEDQPRSATVTCMEDCVFLTIEGSDFNRVLKQAMNEAVMSLPILVDPLLKELPFVQALHPTVQQRARHIVHYITEKKGSVLFWQDDRPQRCYILLSGQVSCWRHGLEEEPSSYAGRDQELASDLVQQRCGELAERLAQVEHEDEENHQLSEAVLQRMGGQRRPMRRAQSLEEVLGRKEATLWVGAVFNDHALLVDEPCEATVTCDRDCQLLCIEKAAFDRVVKEEVIRSKIEELQSQVKRLFRGFPLFEDMGPTVQENVADIARYSFEQLGTVLFKEGDVAELCYIILSGEVTVWKGNESMNADDDNSSDHGWGKEDSKDVDHRRDSVDTHTSTSHRRASGVALSRRTSVATSDDQDSNSVHRREVVRMPLQRRGSLISTQLRTIGMNRITGREGALLPPAATQTRPRSAAKQKEPPARSSSAVSLAETSIYESEGGLSGLSEHSEEEEEEDEVKGRQWSQQQRPPVIRPHPEAYERCAQLAAKLSPISRSLWRKESNPEDHEEGPPDSAPVAALGPGSLFGEWALVNDNPRSATVTCHTDCEFLVIEKCDFDRVVKNEMAKSKVEKLEFLQTHVPGLKQLPGKKREELLQHFEKRTVPWNHVFLEQGQLGDGSIYFVWKGSVEFYTTAYSVPGNEAILPDKGFRRLKVLLRGGMFGSVPLRSHLSVTAVARSSPCEVLHVSTDRLKQLPETVMVGLRHLLDQTMSWREPNQKPPGSATQQQRPGGTQQRLGDSHSLPLLQGAVLRPSSSKVPRPLSGKIPRPLDGKFPGLLGASKGASKTAFGAAGARKLPGSRPTTSQTGWGAGLFARPDLDDDVLELLDLQPGEALALKAKRPQATPQGEEPLRGIAPKPVNLPSMRTRA